MVELGYYRRNKLRRADTKRSNKKFGRGLKVLNLGTDKLVPLVENGAASELDINNILAKELKPFQDFGIDNLVLGCSHFLFKKGN